MIFALAACQHPDPNPFQTTTPPGVVREPALVFDGPRPQHVLMISIDTTRRDQLGRYSVDGVDHLPFLSSLADAGYSLADLQQCSDWTFASTSCTLNGRYPEDDGFVPTLTKAADQPANWLPDGQQTLAAHLTQQGWYTILVSGNGWLGADDNNDQGYVEFEQASPNDATDILHHGLSRLQTAVADGRDHWLLHLHLMEPHPPYNPPPAYLDEEASLPPLDPSIDLASQDGQYDATNQWPDLDAEGQANLKAHLWARYHGDLQYLDDQLAAFWPTLEEAGLLDDTLVVVWTDHGEQFWEHGDQSHAFSLASEENDAIGFFWSPHLESGEWLEGAHAVDLAPTVLQAVGLPSDDPWFSGDVIGTAKVHRPRFATADARRGLEQSVTLDGWKLVFGFDGTMHLYDRNTDRHEAIDRLRDHPHDPHLAPLWDLLEPRIEALAALRPGHEPRWPEDLPH